MISGSKRQNTSRKIRYELKDEEVLELYYSEPRLAVLIDIDVIRFADYYLVVNLRDFITPKTHHLTSHAKQNLPVCCVGVQYISDRKSPSSKKEISCTLDILIQAAGFLENTAPAAGVQSDKEQNSEAAKIKSEIARINGIINELPGAFSGSLKYHMEKKGYTEELLVQES